MIAGNLQHLAVKLAHYASGLDNACSADPSGGIKHAIECRRPNREVTWVNIIASRCEFPAWGDLGNSPLIFVLCSMTHKLPSTYESLLTLGSGTAKVPCFMRKVSHYGHASHNRERIHRSRIQNTQNTWVSSISKRRPMISESPVTATSRTLRDEIGG